ncbi:hypothetical protein KDL44_13020 [bacterium]|nr:hypothetical protein [bacterium]
MASKDKKKSQAQEQAESRSSGGFGGILPFLLVAGLFVGLAVKQFSDSTNADRSKVQQVQQQALQKQDLRALHQAMVEDEARKREEFRSANEKAGVDPEYPAWLFPLYEGLEVLESKREEAESSLGEKMDMWFVSGQVDAPLDEIQQFYRDRLQEAGFRQTQYISIPNGYSFNYANEWYDTRFEIEQTSLDPKPQVRITVYRVRDDAVDFSAVQ